MGREESPWLSPNACSGCEEEGRKVLTVDGLSVVFLQNLISEKQQRWGARTLPDDKKEDVEDIHTLREAIKDQHERVANEEYFSKYVTFWCVLSGRG